MYSQLELSFIISFLDIPCLKAKSIIRYWLRIEPAILTSQRTFILKSILKHLICSKGCFRKKLQTELQSTRLLTMLTLLERWILSMRKRLCLGSYQLTPQHPSSKISSKWLVQLLLQGESRRRYRFWTQLANKIAKFFINDVYTTYYSSLLQQYVIHLKGYDKW